MTAWREAAARDNAAWCDLLCRTHGLPGTVDADAWSVPRRSPPWYPDAVTLRPGVDAEALLARIDAGPGASVKDSFADLDLAPYGFRVLFAAAWILRPAVPGSPPPPPAPADATGAGPPADGPVSTPVTPADDPLLIPVTAAEGLAAWAAAHGGGDLFRPALLDDSRITVLARLDAAGAVVGGAVLSRTGAAVGVSNVFARPAAVAQVWHGVAAARPDLPLVGYESGDDLPPAERAGFRRIGPLRVWLR
ncbi:hypothetical protein [Micromonospora sp. DT233]|uniref:hypothetical protein n=1 Tax=Micromonospora sp. DT233 TaxID=3393432 RepID=UPI003CE96CE8